MHDITLAVVTFFLLSMTLGNEAMKTMGGTAIQTPAGSLVGDLAMTPHILSFDIRELILVDSEIEIGRN